MKSIFHRLILGDYTSGIGVWVHHNLLHIHPDKQELALQQVTMYSTSRFTYGQNIFCNKRKQENVATLNLSLH